MSKYDDALLVIKDLLKSKNALTKEELQTAFPELEESIIAKFIREVEGSTDLQMKLKCYGINDELLIKHLKNRDTRKWSPKEEQVKHLGKMIGLMYTQLHFRDPIVSDFYHELKELL